jgi:hypothetical protein
MGCHIHCVPHVGDSISRLCLRCAHPNAEASVALGHRAAVPRAQPPDGLQAGLRLFGAAAHQARGLLPLLSQSAALY